MPILIAILATVAGVIIVGVGGGLVQPMQRVWTGWIDSIGRESANVRREIDLNRAGGSERAMASSSSSSSSGTQAAPHHNGPTETLPPMGGI